jgi:hypothetical protein
MDISLHPISISKSIDSDFALINKEISKLKSIFYRLILIFHTKKKERFQKKVSKRASVSMDKLYVVTVGGLKLVDSYNEMTVKLELPKVRSSIHRFNELKEDLEKINYNQSEYLKERTLRCLSALFDLEVSLKKRAFKGKAKPTNEILKTAMATSTANIIKSLN